MKSVNDEKSIEAGSKPSAGAATASMREAFWPPNAMLVV